MNRRKVGFGGGCHWCTEAVFQSLRGVYQVEQGFIASDGENSSFSEAVIVHFDSHVISFIDLIAIHLHTHSSTVQHSMRSKFRSAVYYFDQEDQDLILLIMRELKEDFLQDLITKVIPFKFFEPSDKRFHEYYYSDTEKPFCKSHIAPKLELLLNGFSEHVK